MQIMIGLIRPNCGNISAQNVLYMAVCSCRNTRPVVLWHTMDATKRGRSYSRARNRAFGSAEEPHAEQVLMQVRPLHNRVAHVCLGSDKKTKQNNRTRSKTSLATRVLSIAGVMSPDTGSLVHIAHGLRTIRDSAYTAATSRSPACFLCNLAIASARRGPRKAVQSV